METAIFAYSQRGCGLAEKLAEGIFIKDNCRLYTVERFCRDGFLSLEEQGPEIYGKEFQNSSLLIFIGAAGIAVRKIASYVKDKKTDPAVICIDEKGTFVIPLLSGHIGGANTFARDIAAFINAVPVITTATDINGKFAADEWAARRGFVISDMKAEKYIASKILETDVPVICDFPADGDWPAGIFPADLKKAGPGTNFDSAAERYDAGIYIGCRTFMPFEHTLRIIPPVLRLGIGCRKGTGKDQICRAVEKVLSDNEIDERAIKGVYSIDLKADESGLLDYCSAKGWRLTFYTCEELKNVDGEFTASSFVQSVTGVDNVCERAAAAEGTLIVKKTALNGVTCALAAEPLTISF